MHAITIAARNYLAMARTVAESFAAANPDDQFTILLVDAEPGEIQGTDAYDIATPADLPIPADEFGRMAFLYDVTELSTALKPWGLEMLLDRGADVAVYLDPDIFVYDSMHQIEVESLAHGIVLTPHTLVPMPRDGLRPSEADIMGSGIYNLGFIAVRKSERSMLTWWQERLRRDSISAPELMLFTDQRWIDMVPGYYPHKIMRDPGYNVAYWNLDSREVTKDGQQYRVNGVPLRFFHFSGYSPKKPWLLSKYVADAPRVVLSEHPVVRELCDGYAKVITANGPVGEPPYRYNTFTDGSPIVPGLRRMYRQAVIDAEELGQEPPPAPFGKDNDEPIIDWFRDQVVPGSWVTRAAHALWLYRGDLQTAFPDVFGRDAENFLRWCQSSGIAEGSIVPAFLPSSPAAVDTSRSTKTRGVNLVGYFRTETGVGQIGRLLVDAVRATGLPYSTVPAGPTVSREQATFEDSTDELHYPINVVSMNADALPAWANGRGSDLIENRYTIGVWAWEVEDFPAAFDESIDLVDEIWAISSFVKSAIGKRTTKPVHVIPYQIPELTKSASLDRDALNLPDRPYFLFMFDYLSVFARKNPIGVVKAFTQAFPTDTGSGPILVIKSVNGGRFRTQREELRDAVSGRSDIHLIESYLDYDQVEALVQNSLAYVSLHRAEGLGLTLSESMSAGRPVIATNYSGNLDFMDDKNSLLVPYQLVTIAAGAEPYGPPTRWAEPDLAAAAEAMRWVVEHPSEAAELGERARRSVLDTFDLARSADFVGNRIRAIFDSGAVARHTRTPRTVTELIEQHQQLLNEVPPVVASRYPGVPLVRRAVNKALSHHDEQVNIRLNALLDATRRLAGRQSEFEAEMAERRNTVIDRLTEAEEQLAAEVKAHERQFADVVKRLDSLQEGLNRAGAEIGALPYQSDPDALRMVDDRGRMVLGYQADSKSHYADFEDVFRGSEDFIEGRLKPYLQLVQDHQPVVDIGCGRGEFVRLLQKNDIEVKGVDNDESMVQRAQAQGLNVELADGLSALREAKPGSLGSVTSFQVIEHLELAVLREMFEVSFAALAPGGVFIAETVNPHSLPALKTFWLDITHIRPLFPESMLFLAREMGFASAEILFPQGGDDLASNMRGSGEYAIVARKA